MALLSNTAAGYLEISYFHDVYFNSIVNQANFETFQSVKLFVSELDPTVNYEHLFLLYDLAKGPSSNPPSNSLFDLENLKTLINLGQGTINILSNTTAVYGVDFFLGNEWLSLTTRLGLATNE